MFLHGRLTNYSWYQFCEAFDYKKNWNPAGQTYRLSAEKIVLSRYGDEERIVRAIVGTSLTDDHGVTSELPMLDQIEALIETEEGRLVLREHLLRERSAKLVAQFKTAQKHLRCQVCDFDFEKCYGELGIGFIEAHHIKPVADLKPGEKTSIADLIAVCSNCHRMLHRRYPGLAVDHLKNLVGEAFINAH